MLKFRTHSLRLEELVLLSIAAPVSVTVIQGHDSALCDAFASTNSIHISHQQFRTKPELVQKRLINA